MRNIGCVVLAAGESKRMGCPKMLLPFGDSTIIETVVANVRNSVVKYLIVVVGAYREELIQKLNISGVKHCVNDDYMQGMLTSVWCGINSLPPDIEAFMIIPGDQPLINSTIIDDLTEKYYLSGKGMAVPVFKGKRGHPVIISTKYRNQILGLSTGEGLRALLIKNEDDVELVESNSVAILKDVDTRHDYNEILKHI
jgi:molybdenum cofactor cytidylyltransferase